MMLKQSITNGTTIVPTGQTALNFPLKAINLRRVPEPVWSKARESALAARLPFKVYFVQLLAKSSPLPAKQRPSKDSSAQAETYRTVNVRSVPFDVWQRAHLNAVRSGLTLREYLIELLSEAHESVGIRLIT